MLSVGYATPSGFLSGAAAALVSPSPPRPLSCSPPPGVPVVATVFEDEHAARASRATSERDEIFMVSTSDGAASRPGVRARASRDSRGVAGYFHPAVRQACLCSIYGL